MIEIKCLTEINPLLLRELLSGYTSSATYQVTKRENAERTIISLELKNLETPYVKHWDTSNSEIDYYRKVLEEGLSIGAYDGDELVGIAIVEKKAWNRSMLIWEFHINPRYQRKGIGQQMMNYLANVGRQVGCRVMVCETQSTNVPAIQFYRKAGFEVGGIDLSYYTNKDMTDFEVAIFMKRFLE